MRESKIGSKEVIELVKWEIVVVFFRGWLMRKGKVGRF